MFLVAIIGFEKSHRKVVPVATGINGLDEPAFFTLAEKVFGATCAKLWMLCICTDIAAIVPAALALLVCGRFDRGAVG